MGQSESHPSGLNSQVAFHVLRVAEGSPAATAAISPFFDYVVGLNGQPLDPNIEIFTKTLKRLENQRITLQIYSSKHEEVWEAQLVPSRKWSEQGSSNPSLLGLSMRMCDPQHALDQTWHVLDVLEGSPAQSAGLVPHTDYIIGYAGGVLRTEGDFYDVIEEHIDKPLRLIIYNSDYDVTRETVLVPNRNWGGQGLLGCGVGYGLLHKIPKPNPGTNSTTPLPNKRQAVIDTNAFGAPNTDGFDEATYDYNGYNNSHSPYGATNGVQVVPQ